MHSWYIDIFRELVKADVKFVVAGGVALNLLGVPDVEALEKIKGEIKG